jgi:hypothetical protein
MYTDQIDLAIKAYYVHKIDIRSVITYIWDNDNKLTCQTQTFVSVVVLIDHSVAFNEFLCVQVVQLTFFPYNLTFHKQYPRHIPFLCRSQKTSAQLSLLPH